MKKIFLLLVLSFACLFVLAGCEGFVIPGVTPTTPQETEPEKEELSKELKSARSYLIQLYGDGSEKATPADFYRISTVTGLPIEWSVNSEKVSVELVEEGDNAGMTKVSVNIGAEEVKYILSAKVVDSEGNELVLEFNCLIPAAEASTIADFISAADTESFKALTGVITAVNKTEGKTAFILTDETGSIFSYDGAEVALGDKVTVVGQLSLYNGTFPQLTAPAVSELISKENDVKASSGELVQVTAEQIKADVAAGTLVEKYAGKYLEITGYAMLTSTGYVNLKATLADTDPCVNLYANSAIGLTKDYAETKVKVYGFMRGTGATYLTVQVQGFEVVEEELTPEQTLQKAMNGVTLETTEFAENAEIQLPTTLLEGAVTLSWELVGDAVDAFAITEGKLVVTAEKNASQTLKVTATLGEATLTKEFNLIVTYEIVYTSIAEALEIGAAKEHNTYTSEKYYLTGTVKTLTVNNNYANIYVTDGTDEIYVYGVYIEGQKYGEYTGEKFVEGDTVVLYGVLGQYNGTVQMKNADLVSFEAGSSTPDVPSTPDTPDVPTIDPNAPTTTVTAQYTAGSTANMVENQNNAELIGLDANIFNVNTNGCGSWANKIGLNKDGTIRLYSSKEDGQGNILTIKVAEGCVIRTIKVDAKADPAGVLQVSVNGTVVTATDGVYVINASTVELQNVVTGVTAQLHINSIEIVYAGEVSIPEEPDTPEVPTTPETPEEPDTPEVPTEPGTQEPVTEFTVLTTDTLFPGLSGTSYATYNGTHELDGITYTTADVLANTQGNWKVLQFKKQSGKLTSTTVSLTKITIVFVSTYDYTIGSYKVQVGDEVATEALVSSEATGVNNDKGYEFKLHTVRFTFDSSVTGSLTLSNVATYAQYANTITIE